jgi:hypothetical protein
LPKIILSDGRRFFQIFLPYPRTDTSGYNSQQGKVAHSIQEFPLLKINKVSDILRNVKEIKDRVVIIPKHITEKQRGGLWL